MKRKIRSAELASEKANEKLFDCKIYNRNDFHLEKPHVHNNDNNNNNSARLKSGFPTNKL